MIALQFCKCWTVLRIKCVTKSNLPPEAQEPERSASRGTAINDALKVYTERAWPDCDVILGNPPFLGDKFMRRELGNDYVEELRKIYDNRIPGQSDLCCYWFEKARDLMSGRNANAQAAATQGIPAVQTASA